jgi:hypothetical protein
MSRRPTKQLTWAFVLRTFKRVDMIAARYDAEDLAKWLVDRGEEERLGHAQYLNDVWEYVCSYQRELGRDPYAHPNGNCRQCGKEISCDSNKAIYCSRKCRQRAYRVRKAKAEGRNSPVPERPRRLKRPRRAKKRNTTPVRDAPAAAEEEKNVTREPDP